MISGVNQSKNIVTPTNVVKTRNAQAIYGMGIYGIATYGVGTPSGIPTNQNKSSMGGSSISIGSPMGLLLSITYPATVTTGSMVNQSKS